MPNPTRRAVLWSSICLVAAATCGCSTAPASSPDPGAEVRPAPEAVKTVDGLVRTLYESVSFDSGGPDWPLFRSLVLPESTYVSAARRGAPMRVMDLEAFVRDFEDFVASGDVAKVGFHENLTKVHATEFGGIAHAFAVFRPTVGAAPPRWHGLDSIQLVKQDGRWWVASITTQFEGPGLPIPQSLLAPEGG